MSEITPNTPNPVREDAYKQQLAEKLGIDPQYIPGSPIWHSEEEIAAIAEMFSNMAGGGSSGGGVLVVHEVNGTLDKTWQEITNALKSGTLPVICYESPDGGGSIEQIASTSVESGAYNVYLMSDTSNPALSAELANGYPSWL